MKIELGGGTFPRGDGFFNVDQCDGADIKHNLDWLPWPIEADSVDEVYSSHCLEHLKHPSTAIVEVSRICKIGATVILRMPDPMSEGAMVHGHRGTIGEVWFRNVLEHFPLPDFAKLGKTLRLETVTPRADHTWFPRARQSQVFNEWTDLDILRFVPRTCHENEFVLKVEAYAGR